MISYEIRSDYDKGFVVTAFLGDYRYSVPIRYYEDKLIKNAQKKCKLEVLKLWSENNGG